MRRSRCTFDTHITRPAAAAIIKGSDEYPDIGGAVMLYPTGSATLVKAQIWGLPRRGSEIFGFHIHSSSASHTNCRKEATEGTQKKYAGEHYDLYGRSHPFHSGDMPPLFGCSGTAYSIFLTDRFTVRDVISKTVVIHQHSDDFSTQPSGNSGVMIARGVIRG